MVLNCIYLSARTLAQAEQLAHYALFEIVRSYIFYHSHDSTHILFTSPKPVVCIATATFLLAFTRCQRLTLIHLRNLSGDIQGFAIQQATEGVFAADQQHLTCCGPVASSASLSSLTRMNRGNRKEMPRWSTCNILIPSWSLSSAENHSPALEQPCTRDSD